MSCTIAIGGEKEESTIGSPCIRKISTLLEAETLRNVKEVGAALYLRHIHVGLAIPAKKGKLLPVGRKAKSGLPVWAAGHPLSCTKRLVRAWVNRESPEVGIPLRVAYVGRRLVERIDQSSIRGPR